MIAGANPALPMKRRQFLAGAAAVAIAARPRVAAFAQIPGPASRPGGGAVKAFCVDFNWGPKGASPPGMYAQADPAEHVRWYRDLGANTIQTFCVSYNGYAWYPSEVAPITPDLKARDFLGDMVRLGHQAGMKVMGYFTLGANPCWEGRHQALVHGDDSDYIKIPMTLEYLDYFCRSVEDALKKTGVDGFMVDWVRPTQHKRWLPCEQEMYRQIMGEAFPKSGDPSADVALRFDKLAMERAWRHIRWAVRGTRPVVVWTNHPIVKTEYPLWEGHRLLKEVDWVLNEAPELEHLEWLSRQVGPQTLIVQNLCGWEGHDATAWKKIDAKRFGLYGFAKADEKTTLPDPAVGGNGRNIEIIREAYHRLDGPGKGGT
ncbi:MAG TPA: hypothetical protein P5159_16545 [Phycisphaerae bacterium]|nr:hypothetical protein [Phycisphaerae bacterium]